MVSRALFQLPGLALTRESGSSLPGALTGDVASGVVAVAGSGQSTAYVAADVEGERNCAS
jgi:hypothetical protein